MPVSKVTGDPCGVGAEVGVAVVRTQQQGAMWRSCTSLRTSRTMRRSAGASGQEISPGRDGEGVLERELGAAFHVPAFHLVLHFDKAKGRDGAILRAVEPHPQLSPAAAAIMLSQ